MTVLPTPPASPPVVTPHHWYRVRPQPVTHIVPAAKLSLALAGTQRTQSGRSSAAVDSFSRVMSLLMVNEL